MNSNTNSLLVLPKDLDEVHTRLHSGGEGRQRRLFTWLPVTLQERLANAESDQTTEKYFSEREALERKAKWAGVQRNAKRFTSLKRSCVLGQGYIKYVYGYSRALRMCVGIAVVSCLTGTAFYIRDSPAPLAALQRYVPTADVERMVHATAVAIADRTRAPGASTIAQLAAAPIKAPVPISDPLPLTDTGKEQGLPLKLSCVSPSATELQLKETK